MKDKAEIIICLHAGDIERKKVRADFGTTYDADTLRIIDDLRKWDLEVAAVVVTRFNDQPVVQQFINGQVSEEDLAPMTGELNSILEWIEQLGEVDTSGVAPMTSAIETNLRWREDKVTDGGYPEKVTSNAPNGDDGFFTVPKVVE